MNKYGVNAKDLESGNNLPFISKSDIQNGLVYELYCFAKYKPSPTKKVAQYLCLMSHIDMNSLPLPAFNSKLNRLCRDYKSKGGKGRQLLLENYFSIPMTTATQNVSKEEKSIISELSSALQYTELTVEKQVSTISTLRKGNKALQRKAKAAQRKIIKSNLKFSSVIRKGNTEGEKFYNFTEKTRNLNVINCKPRGLNVLLEKNIIL